MELQEYLEKNFIVKSKFAKAVGINPTTLHHILSGKFLPSGKTAQKIVELTNGEVTFEDLFKKKEEK